MGSAVRHNWKKECDENHINFRVLIFRLVQFCNKLLDVLCLKTAEWNMVGFSVNSFTTKGCK